ncbi:GAK system CofD-like protein [candidate division WOR-3 bacterium]|nr:GAK system CofD-like protein [candidate division WOR-3 bacterium]
MRDVSRIMTKYTHNSIHLVTPFDSGGSSENLRKAFNILSVGDLRNRLMALSDQTLSGHKEIYNLFAYRFPKKASKDNLKKTLINLSKNQHFRMRNISPPMKKIISAHLESFLLNMPDNFDLRGANIGNLVLTGGLLKNKSSIEVVLFIFSKLVQAKGIVLPIVEDSINLVTKLEDGSILYGQHLITGKECDKINSPVNEIYLSKDEKNFSRFEVTIKKEISSLIKSADLICYPFGSFYSSLVANFLPTGVGKAISENPNPKIYVPNPYIDPELFGTGLQRQVKEIEKYICLGSIGIEKVLNYVLIDSKNNYYSNKADLKTIKDMGVVIIDTRLITKKSMPKIDPDLFTQVILSLT